MFNFILYVISLKVIVNKIICMSHMIPHSAIYHRIWANMYFVGKRRNHMTICFPENMIQKFNLVIHLWIWLVIFGRSATRTEEITTIALNQWSMQLSTVVPTYLYLDLDLDLSIFRNHDRYEGNFTIWTDNYILP